MAKKTHASPLKTQRENVGLSRSELADLLAVPETTVANWERSLDGATALQIRDLAFLLNVTVDVLRGVETSEKEEAAGTFAAVGRRGLDFGTLKLWVAGRRTEYPIDATARSGLVDQLDELDVQHEGGDRMWLGSWTLNNKLVFANPRYVFEVELVGDDDEAMPSYEHPEVYSALEGWEVEKDVGPLIRQRCEELLREEVPDELLRSMQYIRIVMASGEVAWHFLLEEHGTEDLFALDLEAGIGIGRNRFINLGTVGYYRDRYVNLSNVALIEVPANRYFRLCASGAGD